jgi:citrate synthase
MSASKTARLEFDGKSIDLPSLTGSENEVGLDISSLRKQTGLICFDPGFGNTGSCKSAITYIDGEKGILQYRGYPIEQVAAKSTYLETAWLLLYGELPNAAELAGFTDNITRHTMLHEDFRKFFGSFPKAAHPMPITAATVGGMSAFYDGGETPDTIQETVIRLLAKYPTIAAWSYKHSIGQPYVYPRNDLNYAENFLHMMFSTPCEQYEINPVVAKALDLLLILHADHEQNCSTATVRVVGSSQANMYAAISAGISALWGPLHGGANQKVIEMLDAITHEGQTAEQFVARAKDKASGVRLMGFGHRVYRDIDPRASVLKKACHDVMNALGVSSKQLDIAMKLEEIALNDSYFIERKLYPNVDFYSGIIYKAMGIPVDMFTVMFAMGRMAGWIAQFLEMRDEAGGKISRPRQIYTGPTKREWSALNQRG